MKSLDFVVPGAQRAGTMTLYSILSQHPEICTIDAKDSNYFSVPRDKYSQDEYEQYFSCTENETVTIDVCANYYWNKNVPGRIRDLFGRSVNFIFMVRDPIERAFSAYHQRREVDSESRTIEDVFDYDADDKEDLQKRERARLKRARENDQIRIGDLRERCERWQDFFLYLRNSFYSDFIQRYINEYGSKRVHVFALERLRETPDDFLRRLFYILGVTTSLRPDEADTARHKAPCFQLVG